MKLSDVKPPRPLTHDLLAETIESLDAKVHRLVIDKMVNNTFHAKLEIITSTGERKPLTPDRQTELLWQSDVRHQFL